MNEFSPSLTALFAAVFATQALAQPASKKLEQLAYDELLEGYSSTVKRAGPGNKNAQNAAAMLNEELRHIDPTIMVTISPICPPGPAPAPAGSVIYTQGSQIRLAEDNFKEVVRQKQRELSTGNRLNAAEMIALNETVVPTYLARPQPDVFSTVRGIPCPSPSPAPASSPRGLK